MIDAATPGVPGTAPTPQVTGEVTLTQPNAEASNAPPKEPVEEPTTEPVKHFSFMEFLKHWFEPGATQQHYSLIAHSGDDGMRVHVQATGKAGDLATFHVDDDTVTNVAAK